MASAKRITLNEAKKHNHQLRDYKARIRVAGRQEMLNLLRRKLQEEITEFKTSVDVEDHLDDLGDILEIIDTYRFYLQQKDLRSSAINPR